MKKLITSLTLGSFITMIIVGHYNPVRAAQETNVAVMDFDVSGISQAEGKTLSDYFRSELFKTRRFVIMERNELDKILGEQSFQQTDCVETSCIVEMGRILAVEKMFLGSVNKIGNKYIIEARLIDVMMGNIELIERVECSDCTVDLLPDLVRELALKIAGQISPRGKVTAVSGKKAYVDLGAIHGMQAGTRLEAYRIEEIKDEAGKLLMKKKTVMGKIKLDHVGEQASEGKIVKGTIDKGILVHLDRGKDLRKWWWIGGGVGAAVVGTVIIAVLLSGDDTGKQLPGPPGVPGAKAAGK
jgi:hypothetical protein